MSRRVRDEVRSDRADRVQHLPRRYRQRGGLGDRGGRRRACRGHGQHGLRRLPHPNAVQDVNRSKGCEGDVPCPFDTFVARLSATARRSVRHLPRRQGRRAQRRGRRRTSGPHLRRRHDALADFPVKAALQPDDQGPRVRAAARHPCTGQLYVTELERGRLGDRVQHLPRRHGERPQRRHRRRQEAARVSDGQHALTDFPTSQGSPGTRLENSSCGDEEPPRCATTRSSARSRRGGGRGSAPTSAATPRTKGSGSRSTQAASSTSAGHRLASRFPLERAIQPKLAGRSTDSSPDTRPAARGSVQHVRRRARRTSGSAASPSTGTARRS